MLETYDMALACSHQDVWLAAAGQLGLRTADGALIAASERHEAVLWLGRRITTPAVIDAAGQVVSEAVLSESGYAILRATEGLLDDAATVVATMAGISIVSPPPGVSWGGEWRERPAGPTLAEARAAKCADIAAACDQALKPLDAAYPEREVLSWPQQIAEADALEANADATAPLLRQMAAVRPSLGETPADRVAELARRIRQNAADWSAVAGPIIGTRQALEDAVMAATTVAAVAAIMVNFGGGDA